jgi:hypothetical protein
MKVTRYFTPVVLLIVMLKFSSCFVWPNYDITPIEAGLETKVTGKVYEFVLKTPEVSCIVYAVESLLDSEIGYRYVDSTLTDSLGNYALEFTTSGEGYGYGAEIKLPGEKHFFLNGYGYKAQVYAGSENTVDFNIARTNILRVAITVNDNPYRQLRCKGEYDTNFLEIFGEDADTTLFIEVVPNIKNALYFYIISNDSVPRYIIEQNDTVNLTGNTEDTVSLNLELSPSTFPGRNLDN